MDKMYELVVRELDDGQLKSSYRLRQKVHNEATAALGGAISCAITAMAEAGGDNATVATVMGHSNCDPFKLLGWLYDLWSPGPYFEECVRIEVDWAKLMEGAIDLLEMPSADELRRVKNITRCYRRYLINLNLEKVLKAAADADEDPPTADEGGLP